MQPDKPTCTGSLQQHVTPESMTEQKFITGTDENEDMPVDNPVMEVQLLSTLWKEGPDGFQFNELCFLDVKVICFVKTIRKRITGSLFCTFNGNEEDLGQTVEGFIDDTGESALMEIKNLWFTNDFYHEWQHNKTISCTYQIKNIRHSRGINIIDSCKLEMPGGKNISSQASDTV